MKKDKKTVYVRVRDKIDSGTKCQYYIWFGERSNGKTFSSMEYVLEEYLKGNGSGAYIRRWEEDIKGSLGSELLKGHKETIKRLTKGEFNSYKYFQRKYYLTHEKANGEIDKADNKPFCYSFALSMQEHYKSNSYLDIRTVVLDEFISRNYLPDEFIIFQNLLSTIIRDRDDVIILMLGNTINKYCPYFGEMGLDKVKTMRQGESHIYEYGETSLRVMVTYTGQSDSKIRNAKKSDVYFAFSNPKLKMISEGSWEIDIYPHLPYRYLPKEVIYKFFVIFDGDTLQCNVISRKNDLFVFVHRKTTDVNAKLNELVFQEKQDPRPNYRVRMNRPSSKLENWVLSFFQRDKVFYQSNEIGEVMRNYIAWCLKH